MFSPRRPFTSTISFILASLVGVAAMAAKPGGGGGGGGGGGCTDVFPTFAYQASRSVMLSSANGCRRETLLPENPDLRSWSIHLSADRSSGVLVWAEEPGDAARYIVRRRDFTVTAGALALEAPQNVLPLAGEVLPAGHTRFYRPQVWGTADHSSVFITTGRTEVAPDGITTVRQEWFVHDLADPTQYLVFQNLLAADGSRATLGECTGVTHRQFVASCYVGDVFQGFTAAGTRFYFSGIANGWQGTLRVDVVNKDAGNLLPLSDWSFTAPELVVTAPRDAAANYSEVNVWGVRPELDADRVPVQPADEYAGIHYLDRTGKQTVRNGLFIDTDLCVTAYAEHTSGMSGGPTDLWKTHCATTPLYGPYAGELRSVWESADTLLIGLPGRRNAIDIHRRHVFGGMAGTSQLLIQGADFPDAGL